MHCFYLLLTHSFYLFISHVFVYLLPFMYYIAIILHILYYHSGSYIHKYFLILLQFLLNRDWGDFVSSPKKSKYYFLWINIIFFLLLFVKIFFFQTFMWYHIYYLCILFISYITYALSYLLLFMLLYCDNIGYPSLPLSLFLSYIRISYIFCERGFIYVFPPEK